MARDPDTFRVSPALTNLPMVVAPAVQDAGPQQLVEAGQAITRAGGVANTLYEDALKEQNATRVTEALTQLTERRNQMTYGEAGWASQTGKNALERPDGKTLDEEFGSEFDNTIENLELGLGNDAQRRMFRENAQKMSLDLRGKIQAHTTEQGRTYQLETYAGMADTYSVQMANARTPEEIDEALAGVRMAADRIFSLKGTPEEAKGAVLQKLLTPAHTAQLTRMLEAEEIDGAESYLNKYRDQIDPAVASKLDGAVIEQRNLITGNDIGEAIAASHLGTAATVEPGAIPSNQPIPGFGGTGMPVLGRVTDNFAKHTARGSKGLDIAAPAGSPIRLPYGGKVVERGFNDRAGNYVIIDHGGGVVTSYSHMQGPAKVNKGDPVAAGTTIGGVGSTGNSSGNHLHYRVKVNGQDVDPEAFHNGKSPPPQNTAQGGVVGSGQGTLQTALEDLYGQNLPRKQEEAAERRIRSLYGAREDARKQADEQVASRAYNEIDTTGRLSDATRAAIVGAGMGNMLPSLRTFEKSKAERDKGGGVASDEDGLEGYGRISQGIADGEIGSLDQLLRYKFLVSDSQFKQLTDQFVKSPRDARAKAKEIIAEMQPDVDASGLFVDEDGKVRKDRYNKFVGTVRSTIEGRELNTGKPVTKEERREIVLGLLAADAVNGEKVQNFEIRAIYDSIPARARLNSVRALNNQGVKNPTVAQVVSVWETLTESQRKAYRGE